MAFAHGTELSEIEQNTAGPPASAGCAPVAENRGRDPEGKRALDRTPLVAVGSDASFATGPQGPLPQSRPVWVDRKDAEPEGRLIADRLRVVATLEPVEDFADGALGSSELPLAENCPLAPVGAALGADSQRCGPRVALFVLRGDVAA